MSGSSSVEAIANSLVKVVAVIGLVVINITALQRGIDSVLTGTICSIIAGIAGIEVGRTLEKRRKK